jgi:dTDP-4-dehydrorhamnose reductase
MRVVVTGAGGQIARELVPALDAIGLTHAELDVAVLNDVRAMVAVERPDVIVHCAAWTDVDGCELDPERAMRANGLAPSNVARAFDGLIVYLSTDYVFDGAATTPYVESSTPNPISVYGRSKLAGERALDLDRCAIVRTSWVCGAHGPNMVRTILQLLDGDAPLRFVTDQRSQPTIVADLVPFLVHVVREGRTGIWHATNRGAVSAYELAQEVARAAGSSVDRVEPAVTADLPRPAPRPAYSVLASERGVKLPDFRESLPELIAKLR